MNALLGALALQVESDVYVCIPTCPEQLWSNFKVKLLWVLNKESKP